MTPAPPRPVSGAPRPDPGAQPAPPEPVRRGHRLRQITQRTTPSTSASHRGDLPGSGGSGRAARPAGPEPRSAACSSGPLFYPGPPTPHWLMAPRGRRPSPDRPADAVLRDPHRCPPIGGYVAAQYLTRRYTRVRGRRPARPGSRSADGGPMTAMSPEQESPSTPTSTTSPRRGPGSGRRARLGSRCPSGSPTTSSARSVTPPAATGRCPTGSAAPSNTSSGAADRSGSGCWRPGRGVN